MFRFVWREGVYRFRATFRSFWPGYLSLILLIGLLGGVAMASVAGARRTQSSFPAYLASTNPGDVRMFVAYGGITDSGYPTATLAAVARTPFVRSFTTAVGFDPTLQVLDTPTPTRPIPGESPPAVEGSPDGEFTSQDKVTVVQGRMFDPAATDQIVMTPGAVAESGLHIGAHFRVAFFTLDQVGSPNFSGYPHDQPHMVVNFELVGIVKESTQVVADDFDNLGNQAAVITPALTRLLEGCCGAYTYVSMKLEGGQQHAPAVEAAVRKLTGQLATVTGASTYGPLVAKAERVLRPEAIAFAAFGAIAFLAGAAVGAQVIGRLTRRAGTEAAILRSLGAGPAMTLVDGVFGTVLSIVAGSLLAVGVAIWLSSLAPIGPVRQVYASPGLAPDWTVLAAGFLLLTFVLTASAVAMAYRDSPQRALRLGAGTEGSGYSISRITAASGLPTAAQYGIRCALGSGSRRDAAPVRSALMGAILAVVLVVTTITFGANLTSLVSRPASYGWNWNFAVLAGFTGQENLPATQTNSLLAHDPDVAAWAGVWFTHMAIDGQSVPVLAVQPGAEVGPRLLSGRSIRSGGEVVLGPQTLASLGKRVGDVVTGSTRGKATYHLRVVGTAALPAIGASGPSGGLEIGVGAVASSKLFSQVQLNPQQSSVPGPMAVLVDVRKGVSTAAALDSLNRITSVINQSPESPAGGVISVQRPAEIADYHSVVSTPTTLAAILAAGALAALGLTIIASIRRRSREIALLKAFGFTRQQLATTVSWQFSVSVAVGLLIGVPLGIAFGRWLWLLFAHSISVVPSPTVPALSILVVAVGALVFANLVALGPAQVAARTPTALLLRSERGFS